MTMENYKSTENQALNTNLYTPGNSKPIVSTEESADVDYKQMTKIIDKQLAKSKRAHVKELQKQFNRLIKDNKKNFDQLSMENGRLLKIVEDLQSSQRHLQHQLELHQEREKLAVLREQQDVKRIRDLEDRLSLLLLPPVQNKPISLDDPSRSEITIQTAEIVETVEEPQEVIAMENVLESFPDVGSHEVDIEDDLSQKAVDPSSDEDGPVAGPFTGPESDDDFEDGEKTAPLPADVQSADIAVEVSVEKSQTAREESGEDEIESPSDVHEMAVDPLSERENIDGPDLDEAPLGLDDKNFTAGEEEFYPQSETVVDEDMPDSSPIPASDEWMQPDTTQLEEGFAEFGHREKRDESGSGEEPTTEEIETVGEIPPLGTDSTSRAESEVEENVDPIEEDAKLPIDFSTKDDENESGMDQSPSIIDSMTVEKDEGAGITEGVSADDDIIELQDEISLEMPGNEIEDHEMIKEDAVSREDAELPGMQLDSDAVAELDDTVEPFHPSESDDTVDTGTFEIIELQEENIVSPTPETSGDFQSSDLEVLASEISAGDLSTEIPGSPLPEQLSVNATDVDLTSENAQEFFQRGKSACESKDYSQAAVYFDRFVELVPDEPRGHYNLALLYYRLKNYPTARKHAALARALDYAPVDKIMKKIEAKMKLSANIGQRDGRRQPVEENAPDDQDTLQTDFRGGVGTVVDDETVVYEPDILPHFNIDFSKSEIEDDTDDEPYDLVSPVEDNSGESGLPEIAGTGEMLGEDIATNGNQSNDPVVPITDIKLPGIEKADDVQPEMAVPISASVQQDIEVEASSVWASEGAGSEGAAHEDSGADTNSGYPLYDVGYDALAEYLPDPIESLTDDAVETLDENEQGRTKTNDNTAAGNIVSDVQEIQPQVEVQPTTIYPAGMNDQEENLFEPPPKDPELEEINTASPEETIEPLLSEGDNFSDNSASETAAGDDVVESSEETIPASRHFSLAMVASRQKDYPEAIACFENYVEQLPDEPKGHYNLAILYYRCREYDKASDCANRALQLGAKSSQKIIDKIESKLSLEESTNHRQSGEDPFNKLLSDSLNFPITEVGNPAGEDDTASIWDADELDGDISPSLIAEAAEENSFGTKDDVIVFNSAMAPANDSEPTQNPLPEDKPSLEELKISALQRSPSSGSEGSDDIADHASEIGGTGMNAPSESGRINNLFNLGQKAIDNNEFLKAIKHFTKVTHLLPDDPRGYYYLAVVSCRLKFFETAREHATRAIELGSDPAKKVLEEITAHQATV